MVMRESFPSCFPCRSAASDSFLHLPSSKKVKERYVVGRRLGRGRYSDVRLCQQRDTQQDFAIKFTQKEQGWENEVIALKALQHQHIIRLEEAFDGARRVYIVMELLKGNLFNIVQGTLCYSETVAAQLLENLLSAVAYMHENGVVHRDLKPENILTQHALPKSQVHFDSDPHPMTDIKIADFGLAALVAGEGEGEGGLTRCCGTPFYIAPETVACGWYRDGRTYGKACDMWALGVIAFVILVGAPPINGPDLRGILGAVLDGDWAFPKDCGVSPAGRDFVRRLLVRDPSRRLTARKAQRHPWIEDRFGNDAPLPHLPASVGRFRKSVEAAGENFELSRSWVYVDAAMVAA